MSCSPKPISSSSVAAVFASRHRLRSLIGGRWAISLAGYLVLAPIGAVWIFTTVPEAFMRADGVAAGVFVAITSYLITGGVLLLASTTIFRNRRTRPVPISAVALVGALAWGARSGYLAWFLDISDLPSQASPLTRIVTGSLLGAVIVPTSAWALALLDEFRSTRRRLLDELVAQEMRAENSTTYIEAMRRAVIGDVSVVIDREFDRAGDESRELPAAVDLLAQRMARDLPRTLWTQTREQSSITPRMILRIASRRPMAVWPMVPMAALGTLISIRFLPIALSIAAMGIAMAWAAMVVWIVNRQAAQRSGTALVLIGTLGIIASGGIFALVVQVFTPVAPSLLALSIMVSATFALFTLGGGFAHAVNVAEKAVLSRLTESISEAEVHAAMLDREEARLLREIATVLHGTVGANLTAASMRLRTAIDSGDTVSAVNALHEARRLVDVQLAAVQMDELADPEVLIERIAEAWSGLVAIRSDVDIDESPTPAMMRALDDVITEGVNNAVRHARARTITVRLRQMDSTLQVDVVDDGQQPSGTNAGLGSRILDQVAPGQWSLDAGAGGNTLTVHIWIPAHR